MASICHHSIVVYMRQIIKLIGHYDVPVYIDPTEVEAFVGDMNKPMIENAGMADVYTDDAYYCTIYMKSGTEIQVKNDLSELYVIFKRITNVS